MTRIRMTGWIAATALLAMIPALAETFHSQDSVVFEGTLRKVIAEAAVCNVLEQNHPPAEYERLKPNQGRPLDLWQVDFVVRNESGRRIDHLRASGWVRSEHPPCTNWSGEGPGGGPLLPEPSLPISIGLDGQLRDAADAVRDAAGAAGAPRVLSWRCFGRAPAAVRGMGYRLHVCEGGRERARHHWPEAAVSTQTRVRGRKRRRWPSNCRPISRRIAICCRPSRRCGKENAARLRGRRWSGWRRSGGSTVWSLLRRTTTVTRRPGRRSGEPERAMAVAVRYLRLEGRAAEHYTDALELLNRAESGKLRPAGVEPSCEGQEEGTACWMELANHPGCYVWLYQLNPGWTVTWSGDCAGVLASGTGTLTFVRDGKETKHSGLLRSGKMHGQWVFRYADGNVAEGPYVDGKMHGQWVFRLADGGVQEGPYVEGKRHGDWVLRFASGSVDKGPYVDGRRHGQWVFRSADGDVWEGPYVDGKKNGRWVFRLADGGIQEGPYVDGKQTGQWVLRFADGNVNEGPYVDGKRHGRWVLRFADGIVWEGPYVDGKKNGQWVERFANGNVQEGPYVDGKEHGQWVLRFADGSVHEGPMVDGKKHGRWVERHEDGGGAEGPYVDDKRHGRWVARAPDGRTETVTFDNGVEQTAAEGSVRTAGSAASSGSCEIPGYPSPPGGVANLGLAWCPASVSMQARAFALQAAGAQCAIATGSSSTPEQIQARRREIKEACGRLAALSARDGIPCRCPAAYGP